MSPSEEGNKKASAIVNRSSTCDKGGNMSASSQNSGSSTETAAPSDKSVTLKVNGVVTGHQQEEQDGQTTANLDIKAKERLIKEREAFRNKSSILFLPENSKEAVLPSDLCAPCANLHTDPDRP